MSNTGTCPSCGSEDLHTPDAGDLWNNANDVADVSPGSEIRIDCGECKESCFREYDGKLTA